MDFGTLLLMVAALILGLAVGYYINHYLTQRREARIGDRARNLLDEAQTKAKELELKGRDEASRIRDEAEQEAARRRAEFQREEERLGRKREQLDDRLEKVEQRDRKLSQRQSQLDKRANDLTQLEEQRTAELSRIAQMSVDDARKELLEAVERSARDDMARVIRQVEAEIKEESDRRAREIVTLAIQRIAAEAGGDVAVSVVPLPNDEMKGRIIGRNGRNIRAIEKATGVDIVVDDTPEAVTLSSFDPVRREVARVALTTLIQDGRIHPARIEKLVEDSQAEVNAVIKEEGERATIEAGVPGLHPEVQRMLGRLKFRTSYGQNQLYHAIETARLAGIMAAELGADVKICKAGGLLHDLGKAMDHEMEGSHAMLGADYAKRYGVDPRVLNCIASHHHEVEAESIEAVIVEAADAVSGSRPGARRESIELYLKRVKDLEDIANSFDGVAQSYAIQAGREIRIVVRPEDIDDLASLQLSKNIARKIEETMQYPGQIKVTVIRETRAVDYAK
jgi:ribonuclease Y